MKRLPARPTRCTVGTREVERVDDGDGAADQTSRDVISAHGLVKTFGATRALDDLDLSVAAGEVHGFLGPNGAGKSTAIRVLLGLIRKDAGEVSLFGADPWS